MTRYDKLVGECLSFFENNALMDREDFLYFLKESKELIVVDNSCKYSKDILIHKLIEENKRLSHNMKLIIKEYANSNH